jgi:DNA-binding SARP family transcriptional activator
LLSGSYTFVPERSGDFIVAIFRVRLFGKLSVVRDGEDISDSLSPKSQELLAYLLVFRERWHARERLAADIWPDSPASEARARFRRLLWRLHHGLDARDEPSGGLLRIHPEWVGINPDADLWLDLGVVEQASPLINKASKPLTRSEADDLQVAADLIRGELLGNWYHDWCITERERLMFVQLSLLGRLTDHYIATRQIERGLAAASDMLRLDRAHEGAHRKAIYLYALAGDRTRAIRQYQACERALQDELGVEPEQSTLTLYGQVRGDGLIPVNPDPTPNHPEPGSGPPVGEISARIDRLQSLADRSHDQIWRELHQLRNSIGDERI